MSVKAFLFYQYARWICFKERDIQLKAIEIQDKFLHQLISKNKSSLFGRDHDFHSIHSYDDFCKKIPLRTYENYIPYIDKIKQGDKNILTSDSILYLLMTSGTTAGTKYIPITKSGLKAQIQATLKLLCNYSVNLGHARFMDNQMIFLQGSPELSFEHKIPLGRLSGVVYHHIPRFFQRNKLPSYQTNVIENWQTKVDTIVEETVNQDISILGGIPPWCIQYFEKLLIKSGAKDLKELYPNLSCYIYGGLDFSSYRANISKLIGDNVQTLQTFPASEGFFGIQDKLNSDEMLLLVNQGIFYEFKENGENPIPLCQVKTGIDYELIITNESGLWRYQMGDLVRFMSLKPYRIKVVGRTSQFISAFGEHVIGYEIEKTMQMTIDKYKLQIEDYHVSPNVNEKCYEWRIEWRVAPTNIKEISSELDSHLSKLNKYYDHLIVGKIINPCQIITLYTGYFENLRKSLDKEGGQNKVVRLGNRNKMEN